MAQTKTHSNEGDGRNVDLVEFSVVLLATSNNPSILNPDFLRYNNIVDASWQVQEPRISTPAFSQVIFKDGLTVTADPDRIIFAQTGDKLAAADIVCPEMAKRYAEKIPHVPYRAVGINPKGFKRSEGEAADRVADALRDGGVWLSFKDMVPEIQLKAVYRYDRRTISLDIVEAKEKRPDGSEIPGVLFQANMHHDILEVGLPERIKTLLSVLASWREALTDFQALAKKFYERERNAR